MNTQSKWQRKKRKERQRWALMAMIVGGVMLIGAAVSLISGKSPPPSAAVPDSHDEEGIPYPEAPRISLAEAKVRYDAGTAIFVDVRDADSYAASHIPGALSIPLAELPLRLGELDPTDWIITYCT